MVDHSSQQPFHCHHATDRHLSFPNSHSTPSTPTPDPQVEFLKETPFFLHLTQPELEQFAAIFQVRDYANGFQVYGEGDPSVEFFIIASGEVDMTTTDAEGNQQFLCTKKTGDFFGEAAVLGGDQGSKRSATVTTTDKCTMLVATAATWERYSRQAGEEVRRKLTQVMGERMVTVLKQIEWLSHLSDWKLHLLANLFRYETKEKGEIIFEEGDQGRELYIVAAGSVDVSLRDEEGHSKHLATLEEGKYFGEIALIMEMPRTATISAHDRCLLLVLGHDDFRNFLHVVPELKESFAQVVKDRTAQQFKKYKVPFFANIPDGRYTELSSLCETRTYAPGEVVFNEGDHGDCFYLTVFGTLDVIKAGTVVASIPQGRYFGEIALVSDGARTATIRAKTKSVLLSITKENFESFFRDDPGAYADFALKIGREAVPLVVILQHPSGMRYFEEQLREEFSTENLLFWHAANAFERAAPGMDPATLAAEAQRLCDRFVSDSAAEQVNIDSKVRGAVCARVKSGGVDAAVFRSAKEEILNLMSRDSFKRFKESERFQRLLGEIGSYQDNPQQDEGKQD